MMANGFQPVGMEIVGVGASSDAHHIITPFEGWTAAGDPHGARQSAGRRRSRRGTCTRPQPGDATEIENALEMLHPDVVFTARKARSATECPSAAAGS
jgi:hypothetical protein